MPRDKAHVVAERKQLVADDGQKRGMVAAWEIGTADRALEQHITDESEPRLWLIEHHMARSVAGAVQHLEMDRADLDGVAVSQPLIRRERRRRRKTEQLGLLRQAIKPEPFLALRPDDGNAERIAQLGRGADVVEVAMGKQNFFQHQAACRRFILQAFSLAAGIDQCRAALRVPDQRAVLLIRGDGENGKFHARHYPFKTMPAPDALLLISSHCPHCPAMLAALSDLLKQGTIGRLEAINLEQRPELAQALGVRSVPWLRIGRIELAGLRSKAELAEWVAKADSESGMVDYFHMLLKEGQLPHAQAVIEAEPELLAAVLPIVGNVDASLNVRLGAGVLLEQFAGSEPLRALLPRLGELSQHADSRVRADACHYLGLTGDARARPWLDARTADDDADVREIAAESLDALPPRP